MNHRTIALAAAAVLLAVGVALPVVSASHCESRITVYSRHALAQGSPPPSINYSGRTCLSVLGQPVHQDAVLVPYAEQVFVRIGVDYGPSVPTLPLVLDGLGFANQSFLLHAAPSAYGWWVYEMSDFATIPGGPNATGELRVTIQGLGTTFTATYRTTT